MPPPHAIAARTWNRRSRAESHDCSYTQLWKTAGITTPVSFVAACLSRASRTPAKTRRLPRRRRRSATVLRRERRQDAHRGDRLGRRATTNRVRARRSPLRGQERPAVGCVRPGAATWPQALQRRSQGHDPSVARALEGGVRGVGCPVRPVRSPEVEGHCKTPGDTGQAQQQPRVVGVTGHEIHVVEQDDEQADAHQAEHGRDVPRR